MLFPCCCGRYDVSLCGCLTEKFPGHRHGVRTLAAGEAISPLLHPYIYIYIPHSALYRAESFVPSRSGDIYIHTLCIHQNISMLEEGGGGWMDGVLFPVHRVDTRWGRLALLCAHLSNHRDEPPVSFSSHRTSCNVCIDWYIDKRAAIMLEVSIAKIGSTPLYMCMCINMCGRCKSLMLCITRI